MPRNTRRRASRRVRVNGAFGRILAFGPLNIPVVFVDPAADNVLRAGNVVVDADGIAHPVTSALVRGDGTRVPDNTPVTRRIVTPTAEVLLDADALWDAIGQPNGVTPLTTFVEASALTDGTYSVMRSLTLLPGSVVGSSLRSNDSAAYSLGVLFAALARENVVAMTQIIFEGSPRYIAIQADGGVALLRYASEATSFPPTIVADVVEAADAILYARMLVAGRKSVSPPTLHDTSGAQIAAYAGSVATEVVADGFDGVLREHLLADASPVVPANRDEIMATLRTMPTLLGVAGVGVPAVDPFRPRARRRPLIRNVSDDEIYQDRSEAYTVNY